MGDHGGIDKAGFYRDDADAGGLEAIAKAGEVRGEGGLGGAVDVIAGAAAIAGDARYGDDAAGGALLEAEGEMGEEGDGAEVIDAERGLCEEGVELAGLLVRERAVADDGEIEAAELLDGGVDEGGVEGEIVKVEGGGVDRGVVTELEIAGDELEPGFRAGGEEEGGAGLRQLIGEGLGNAGGGADDEGFFHGVSCGRVTRRQKLEENAGSMKALNLRQLG